MKKTLQTIVKKTGLFSALIGVSSMFAQTTYTFTNAGATGRLGPTQIQCDAAYGPGVVTVSVQGIQQWVVPATGVYSIRVAGGQGGDKLDYLANGGKGQIISNTVTLTAGQIIKIIVGQQGGQSVAPANSGGGGGGGGSFVYDNATNTLYTAAGGGGGIGAGNSTRKLGRDASTLPASGANQQDNDNGPNSYVSFPSTGDGGVSYGFLVGPDYDSGGGAGWLSNGKNGVQYSNTEGGKSRLANWLGGNFDAVRNPYVAVGGFGGGGAASDGGGGGGGYTGGNGGRWNSLATGGGGGTCYDINNTNPISLGLNTGHGSVLITSLFGVTISQTATISCNSYSTAALSSTVSGGVGPYTYTWMPTGGNTVTATGLTAGTYTCFVKDAGALITSRTFTVTQPSVVIASVASQTNVTCYGSNNGAITLTTTTGGTAPYSYTWSPTGGNTVTATGLVANVYSCIVKDANNCSASSAPTATITQPAAFINASSSNSVICAGETATLTATGATSYTWSTGATSPAIVISPSVTTTYTVTGLLAGCTNSLTGTQTVNACTGINEVTASLISVYPNPNNGIVNITLTAALAQNSTLEIYDALGKLVVKQVLAKEINAVNMSNLDNGIYVFKILNNNNTVKIGKLIKQ